MTTGPRRVPFDEEFLRHSLVWLDDAEMQRLTGSGPVDAQSQRTWYDGLATRTDYAVWGIAYDGVPVGAMGLKRIGVDDGGEYFMYIGDRDYWGRRISQWAFHEICDVARGFGLRYLYGRTAKDNERSLAVNFRHGYRVARDEGDSVWLVYSLWPDDRLEPSSGTS